MQLQEAMYFDFQGTLVDVRGIRHLLDGPTKNFEAFHYATASCPPIPWVCAEARRAHEEGFAVLLGTGMNEQFRRLVSWWLADHNVHVDDLRMRPDGDYRKDFMVKRDMWSHWKQVYTLVHAYDDRPAVCDFWESEGVSVTRVPGWEAQ